MLKFLHWNCNSIKSKYEEFLNFLEKNRPSLISINETKLSENDTFTVPNYHVIRSDRNSRGGGVAILINNKITYEQIGIFDKFNLEIICVKILFKKSPQLHFLSWYLPPNADFPKSSFFQKLSKLKNFVLCGDLNSKSKAWFANVENQAGKKLEDALSQSQISIYKNKLPTHFSSAYNSSDITDLILSSPSLTSKLFNLKIHSSDLDSDHFPMIINLANHGETLKKNHEIIKVDNLLLSKLIEEKIKLFQEIKRPLNEVKSLNDLYVKIYQFAKLNSTKNIIKKVDNINLPIEILTLIESKKNAKKLMLKFKLPTFKTKYNFLNKLVKNEISSFKLAKRSSELEELALMKASESKFWNSLKKAEGSHTKKVNIPFINFDGNKIYNNKDKAQAFGLNLSKIFVPYEDSIFDDNFKKYIENFTSSDELFNYDSNEEYAQNFSLSELEEEIKNCKLKSAAGPDDCPNKVLKNLGPYGLCFILQMINKSFNNNDIPIEWKTAKIIMIPKKPNDSNNINNYRPISLTNTIVKLIERLVKNRLVHFLESNNLISNYQSGFRENRSALDNVFYFKQKCMMAFDQKEYMGGIVFDVEKAFDKVWHEGLFYKIHLLKIPNKIAKWIKNFLTNRLFYVSINDEYSDKFKIKTGTPQGSILSAILFSIFINDIPLKLDSYPKLNALLYADDLFCFYHDKNLNRIKIVLQKYLNNLESWLRRWRLKVAPHKCSYNIYSSKGGSKKLLDLNIFGKTIGQESNPRYLGILLDTKLNFNFHIKYLKEKCFRKYNFLKIIKKCNTKTKIIVYNSIIRSNMDFGGPLFNTISDINKRKLRAIQYHSMRFILNRKYGSSGTEMRIKLGLKTLDEHFTSLKKRYLEKALLNNEMLKELKEEVNTYQRENPDKNISIFS